MDTELFRKFIADEWNWRQRCNPRFSLRAYARRLRVDHATLSQLLRGRRKITPAAAYRLAGDLEQRILALVTRPDFRPDARALARTLDASTTEVQSALTRLLRAGALEMLSESIWINHIEELST
jgi:transcriptional regulator with XRE-family HTH domain